MKRYNIPVPGGELIVESDGRGTALIVESPLKDEDALTGDPYNAAIDGLEALVMALAATGLDVAGPKFVKAINIALEGIDNNT